jgi:hypothetical protein
MVKMITRQPCSLAVRPTPHGWEVLCAPGPLAQLFSHLASISQPDTTVVDGKPMLIIPLTCALDSALENRSTP